MSGRINKEKLIPLIYFMSSILVGSLFLVLPISSREGGLSYLDALFEATSAVCVTGLAVVDTTTLTRFGQTIILVLIQLGGLGIVTFTTLYLFMPWRKVSMTTHGMIRDYTLSSVEYRTRRTIREIIAWTACFELIAAFVIWPTLAKNGYSFYDALFHSISAFCNAGFSTLRSGMESFRDNVLLNVVTMLLIVFGGIGFIVLQDIMRFIKKEKRHLSYHSSVVLRTTAVLIVLGAIVFYVLEHNHAYKEMSQGSKVMAALFQSVTPRTCGFDTVPQANLSGSSQLATIILMFIGASPGSTGGGIKTVTLYILLLVALRMREGGDTIVDRYRTVTPNTVFKAITALVRGATIVLVATTILIVSERAAGHTVGLETAIFECVSAFGTVGLSIGITPYLTAVSKLVLIAAMFMGRAGLFVLAIPPSKYSPEPFAKYPKADVLL